MERQGFREVTENGITAIILDEGLVFNAERVGPMNFNGLRQADYGKSFRMPIFPELAHLVYASLENPEYDSAQNVIKALRRFWLTGNTGVHYVPDGMYVQYNPEIREGRIFMDGNELKSKLGSHEERRVVFSDDRTIGFAPKGYSTGEQETYSQLAGNPGIIALARGEEGAEKLVRASEHYRRKPYFWALDNVDSPETRFAGLSSFDLGSRLDVGASGSEDYIARFSFGVCENELKSGGSQ